MRFYKTQDPQELGDDDFTRKVEFCTTMTDMI